MIDELDALVAEQADYYRARAAEYDATVGYAPESKAALIAAIERFQPRGRVLELACGTGQWTQILARTASELTAVDASAEMLELNQARLGRPEINYIQADLFAWKALPHRFDVVFFAAWLSHVPPQRFDAFWGQVAAALADGGRVFVIDELPAAAVHETPGVAVEELQALLIGKGGEIGRDRFRLARHASNLGGRHHTCKRRDHEIPSVHRVPQSIRDRQRRP